jgi:hypothetical protein
VSKPAATTTTCAAPADTYGSHVWQHNTQEQYSSNVQEQSTAASSAAMHSSKFSSNAQQHFAAAT